MVIAISIAGTIINKGDSTGELFRIKTAVEFSQATQQRNVHQQLFDRDRPDCGVSNQVRDAVHSS